MCYIFSFLTLKDNYLPGLSKTFLYASSRQCSLLSLACSRAIQRNSFRKCWYTKLLCIYCTKQHSRPRFSCVRSIAYNCYVPALFSARGASILCSECLLEQLALHDWEPVAKIENILNEFFGSYVAWRSLLILHLCAGEPTTQIEIFFLIIDWHRPALQCASQAKL